MSIQQTKERDQNMTWVEFAKTYHFRVAERCCANCKHGKVRYGGECDCTHPLVVDDDDITGRSIADVCDLWDTNKPNGNTSRTVTADEARMIKRR